MTWCALMTLCLLPLANCFTQTARVVRMLLKLEQDEVSMLIEDRDLLAAALLDLISRGREQLERDAPARQRVAT